MLGEDDAEPIYNRSGWLKPLLRERAESADSNITLMIRELESGPSKPLLLKIPRNLDIYSAEQTAVRLRSEVEKWEQPLILRVIAAQCLKYGEGVYDKTDGRIKSTECKRAARYLESAAQKFKGEKRKLWLEQAQRLDELADKICDKHQRPGPVYLF